MIDSTQASSNFYQGVPNIQVPLNFPLCSNLYIAPANSNYTLYTTLPFQNLQQPWLFYMTEVPQQITLAPTAPEVLQSQDVRQTVAVSPPAQNSRKRARKQCPVKQLESAKKNGESNLINQLLAFLNNKQLSEKLVNRVIRKIIGSSPFQQKIKDIFYNIVRIMNFKRGRKYVNRTTILRYYQPDTFCKQLEGIDRICEESGAISLAKLCQIFRIVTFQFIHNYSTVAVLTSRRISEVAKPDHLRRRRRLEQNLLQ